MIPSTFENWIFSASMRPIRHLKGSRRSKKKFNPSATTIALGQEKCLLFVFFAKLVELSMKKKIIWNIEKRWKWDSDEGLENPSVGDFTQLVEEDFKMIGEKSICEVTKI